MDKITSALCPQRADYSFPQSRIHGVGATKGNPMISLSIVFGPAAGGAWGFMFNSKRTADIVLASLKSEDHLIEIADDFGQRALIVRESIYGILVEDMDIAADAVIERSLHQARTQVRAHN
jgi:hypothetical protein